MYIFDLYIKYIFIGCKVNHTILTQRANDFNLIEHYMLYKTHLTSYKHLAFIKFVGFNRQHLCGCKVDDYNVLY